MCLCDNFSVLTIYTVRNSYGTPTSLSVYSPHGPVPSKQYNLVTIPDSPSSRGTSFINTAAFNTSDHELRAARSESVELDSIPKGSFLRDAGDSSLEKTQVDSETLMAPVESSQIVLKTLVSCPDEFLDQPVDLVSHVISQEHDWSLGSIGTSSAKKHPLPDSSVELVSRGLDGAQVGPRDIFDPIDTDGESPHNPRRLSNVKRLKGSQSKLRNSMQRSQDLDSEHVPGNSVKFAIPQTRMEERVATNSQSFDEKHMQPAGVIEFDPPVKFRTSPQELHQGLSCNDSVRFGSEHLDPQPLRRASADAEHEKSNGVNGSNAIEQTPPQSLPMPHRVRDEDSTIAVKSVIQPVPSEKEGILHIASIVQNNKPSDAMNQSTSKVISQVFDKDITRVENIPKDNAGEMQLADEGTKESKLIKGKGHSETTMMDPKAIQANQKVQCIIPAKQKPKIPAVKAQSKAGTQTDGSKGERTRAKEKTKPAEMAETKKSAKEQQCEDGIDMKKPKHREQHGGDTLLESTRSTLPEIKKPIKGGNPAARDDSAVVSKLPEVNGKGRISQYAQLKPKVVDQNRSKLSEKAVSKPRDSSEAQSRSSMTPSSTRTELDRARKSMTPAFPSSSASKPRPIDSVSGTPLGKLKNPETQLKSSLRHTPSTVRPRVKFQDDSVIVPDSKHQNRDITSALKPVSDKTVLGAFTESKPPKDNSKKSKASSTKAIKQEPKDTFMKVIKQEKEKVQTKLKTTRNKLKDRVVDPPVSLIPASPEKIVISSDSEHSVSSYYSDDGPKTRNAKAGPSKRRKPSARRGSGEEIARIKVEAALPSSNHTEIITRPNMTQSSNPITKPDTKQSLALSPKATQSSNKRSSDPAIKTTNNQSSNSETIVHNPDEDHSSPAGSIDPRILALSSERSSPRAPAVYMSRAISINSSSSSSVSESDSGDDSSSSRAEAKRTPIKSQTNPEIVVPDTNGDIEEVQPEATLLSDFPSASQSAGARSNSSRNSELSKTFESKRTERAAEEQLQREYHQSTQSSCVLSPAPVILSVVGQKPSMSSVSSPRAANFPWSRMTDLMKIQPAAVNARSLSERHNYGSALKPTESKAKNLSSFSISGSSSDKTSSSDGED